MILKSFKVRTVLQVTKTLILKIVSLSLILLQVNPLKIFSLNVLRKCHIITKIRPPNLVVGVAETIVKTLLKAHQWFPLETMGVVNSFWASSRQFSHRALNILQAVKMEEVWLLKIRIWFTRSLCMLII